MDMPGYLDYGKMYEMNPGAFMQAQGQIDLARQFQQDKLQQQQYQTQGIGLDTMFKQDSYGDRLRSGEAAADQAQYKAADAGIDHRINAGTEQLQFDAKQRELITKASKADLDQFEYGAQRMAYSQDPAERAEGERLMKMHKDFIKIRDEQGFREREAATQRAHQMALQRQNQAAMLARQQAVARAKLEAKGSGEEKLTTDQLRARLINRGHQARQAGDYEMANELYREAQYITDIRASERPDTGAGKVDIGATSGLPTVPPRQAPLPPTGERAPAAAPQMTLDQVKAMYPGRTDEQIRAAWKNKFGVDLK